MHNLWFWCYKSFVINLFCYFTLTRASAREPTGLASGGAKSSDILTLHYTPSITRAPPRAAVRQRRVCICDVSALPRARPVREEDGSVVWTCRSAPWRVQPHAISPSNTPDKRGIFIPVSPAGGSTLWRRRPSLAANINKNVSGGPTSVGIVSQEVSQEARLNPWQGPEYSRDTLR